MPPNIDDSLTSSDVIAQEGDNVSLKCKANGSPPPSLKWKRDDGSRMVINKSLEGKVSRKDKTRHLSYWLLIFFSFFLYIFYFYHSRLSFYVYFTMLSITMTSWRCRCLWCRWRYIDNAPLLSYLNSLILWDSILFNKVNEVEGELLELERISRLHMGAYLCIASNGVPPSVSKRIKVSVDCEYIYISIYNKTIYTLRIFW